MRFMFPVPLMVIEAPSDALSGGRREQVFYSCTECGSVVTAEARMAHWNWHDDLATGHPR